jgi:transcriptional regulator with XRE-family HTH domain
LALKIRRILREKGLSQYELAEKMYVSPAQITKILSGKENLGIKTISKIERALGVNLIEIPMPEGRESIELSVQTSIRTQQPLKYRRKGTFTSIVTNNILA